MMPVTVRESFHIKAVSVALQDGGDPLRM